MIPIAIKTEYGIRAAEAASDLRLSTNFLLSELANTSGSRGEAQYLFSDKSNQHEKALQIFRDIVGVPVNVNSGYRQAAYNKQIGGDAKSAHLLGLATDIQPPKGAEALDVIRAWVAANTAAAIYQGAVNVYNNYYHLESYSQDLFNYGKPYTIRVYSTDEQYNYFRTIFRYDNYNIIRVKK